MFKLNPNPEFKCALTIEGQGFEQVLELVYIHMDADEYLAMLDAVRKNKMTPADAVLKLVKSWNADGDLTKEVIVKASKSMPGFDWAIIGGYSDAIAVQRKGN